MLVTRSCLVVSKTSSSRFGPLRSSLKTLMRDLPLYPKFLSWSPMLPLSLFNYCNKRMRRTSLGQRTPPRSMASWQMTRTRSCLLRKENRRPMFMPCIFIISAHDTFLLVKMILYFYFHAGRSYRLFKYYSRYASRWIVSFFNVEYLHTI